MAAYILTFAPQNPNDEISVAKQLLEKVASNLNDIEKTLREAVEQNTPPLDLTCDEVNKAHEVVEEVIDLLQQNQA